MKITRARKVNKTLSFYSNNFGFREPYQVLVDGTLCFSALKEKVKLQEQIPKYFGAQVKLLTTQCVILETEKLGPALFGAMLIAKQLPVHRCGHEGRPVSGSACLLAMVDGGNASRYTVGTQDRELQQQVRLVPGVPLLYLHHCTPTLEAPSPASLQRAAHLSEAKFGAEQQPGEQVAEVRRRVLGEEPTPEPRRPRRKRPAGPNPLSCKKRKKDKSLPPSSGEAKPAKSRKRARKRVKVPQHVRQHLADNS